MCSEMEMPTLCKECRGWFDLNDGKPSKDGRYQLCQECSEIDNSNNPDY
ncbi:hypothetical protein [Bizionia argentinensis]|nr:hypothetical protein [Bizionia argentinensis]